MRILRSRHIIDRCRWAYLVEAEFAGITTYPCDSYDGPPVVVHKPDLQLIRYYQHLRAYRKCKRTLPEMIGGG